MILSGSELLMRSPGIVAIHATTSANSLHYIYGASGDDTTRKLALLQAVGWQPLYRGRAKAPAAPFDRRPRTRQARRRRATRPSARSSRRSAPTAATAARKALGYLNAAARRTSCSPPPAG